MRFEPTSVFMTEAGTASAGAATVTPESAIAAAQANESIRFILFSLSAAVSRRQRGPYPNSDRPLRFPANACFNPEQGRNNCWAAVFALQQFERRRETNERFRSRESLGNRRRQPCLLLWCKGPSDADVSDRSQGRRSDLFSDRCRSEEHTSELQSREK